MDVFRNVIESGRHLAARLEGHRDLHRVPPDQRMFTSEIGAWFRAAGKLIIDLFGRDSKEHAEWLALQDRSYERTQSRMTRDSYNEAVSAISDLADSIGLLTEFDVLTEARSKGKEERVPFNARVLRVMIASPSDVAAERRIVQAVIHDWNAVHSQQSGTVLLPVAWETHASPAMGDRAQAIINRQLLADADLLVAVFWTRIGTPTDKAVSGTVEEIEEHLTTGKPTMLYFSTAPVAPDTLDPEQYRLLRDFRESCRQRGLVEEYDSIEQFREKFGRQLAQAVIRHFSPETLPSEQVTTGPVGVRLSPDERDLLAGLSTEARELLAEAGKDNNGTVLMTETMGGMSVETNERNFVERGNARSEARGRRIVQELVQRGLLEQRDDNGEVFSITDDGFRVLDLLR